MESVNAEVLFLSNRPWLHFLTVEEFAGIDRLISNEHKLSMHRFSGADMRTLDNLFQVYQEEFKFPSYFGFNWPAFSELMGSLEEVASPVHFTLITNSEQLLVDDSVEIKTFLRQINDIGRDWSMRVGLPREWGPDPVAFNTVLVADLASLQKFSNLVPWKPLV